MYKHSTDVPAACCKQTLSICTLIAQCPRFSRYLDSIGIHKEMQNKLAHVRTHTHANRNTIGRQAVQQHGPLSRRAVDNRVLRNSVRCYGQAVLLVAGLLLLPVRGVW